MPLPSDLTIGVEAIDEDHREFFRRMEEFHAAVNGGTAQPPFLRVFLAYLFDYAVKHFRAEEKFMWEEHYPGLRAHRAEHLAFWRSCLHIQECCEANGYAPECASALVERCATWLAGHIEKEDRAYMEWVKAKRDGML